MKLETNMYVRTKDGIIAKCTEIRINRYMFDKIILENGYYNDWEFIDIPKEKSLIKKASYNIIDLIKKGDYVNGREVIDIKMKCDETIKCLITKGYDITNEMIKSIVTKEQFESMEYNVNE